MDFVINLILICDGKRMMENSPIEEETKKPKKVGSFGIARHFFFGKVDWDNILPYPRPSLEEKERIDLLCHKLRQFCETHIDPVAIDRSSKIPDEVLQGLAKMGVLGLAIPQKYGGLGLSLTGFCKVLEVVSQRCTSTAAFLSVHHSIGYKAILLFGTPEQKQKWLPAIAKGEIISAFALSETNAGSDANGVETKAVYDPERNIFLLTGKKLWITNGNIANVLTVFAKTKMETPLGKKLVMTAFIVTPDMPGFKVTDSALDKVGLRGISCSNLEFVNMEVPVENRLGKLGDGLTVAFSVLNYGRITVGATCAGPAKILVDDALKHACNRYQFQRRLSSFPLVKNKLSMIAAFAYAIDAVTYFTAGKIDAGAKDFMLEGAIVKVFSTESLWWMIFETMQIFGGKAVFSDYPYELMMRNCRLSMIAQGSNDVMRMFTSITGIMEVGLSFNAFLDSLKKPFTSRTNLKEGFKHLSELFWPARVQINSPLLQKDAKMLARAVRKLGRKVVQLLLRHGSHVIDKQLDLEHIATALIGIYTMATVISKLDSDLERVYGKAELLGHDVETAKFFCRFALKNANFHLNSLFDSQDQAAEQLSNLLMEDL